MNVFFLAALLALAPEPPLSDTDDWNSVVALNERVTHCDAVELFRTEPDTVCIVLFRCAEGQDELLVFALKGEDGWYPIQREWRAAKSRTKGEGI